MPRAKGPGATVIPLPVLADQPGQPLRISPTDVSQFLRLEQCERFLRFRLAERDGQKFMEAYDVTPQRITPLLTRSGAEFEDAVEQEIGSRCRSIHYADRSAGEGNRPDNNHEVAEEARRLPPGQVIVLFQPRLHVELDGWLIRGDVDLLRLERQADGTLTALIADMKSTTTAKVEHRLQVAFYQLMLARLLERESIACALIQTGILYRAPAGELREDDVGLQPLREAARRWFALEDTLLEIVSDPDAYLQAVRDLVTGADSTARRVSAAPFKELGFALSYKCDGCLYNEYCMKWCAEHEDLSLLPHLSGVEKTALRRAGLLTIADLATLKEFAPSIPGAPGRPGELVPAPGREELVRQLAATWPVGPRLDELVHRARSFRRHVRKTDIEALTYIPGKGTSALPAVSSDLNANLVRVYVDAQHDYLHDRVYLLGALVAASRDGAPDPGRRRAVIFMTDAPPESAEQERQLFIDWTRQLAAAVVELAAPGEDPAGPKSAPLHFIFYNRFEQRLLLEGLSRNFPPILQASPPLYDFLTQLAAFDTPVATFLDEEVRSFKNFPMTCQSLQALATYLKFDWNRPQPFRELFKARLFDYLGKLDIDGVSEWFTKRSRFNSQVPLEYAYGAWDQLPAPKQGKIDEFADFRAMTPALLQAFQLRRLEALEHVSSTFPGNPLTRKTPFVLPDLTHFEDKAHDLARALHEFVTIERHVDLGGWQTVRHAPPERRVLMGETLLVRYCEQDQDPTVATDNREHQRRQALHRQYEAEFRAANPDDRSFRPTKEQKDQCRWSHEGMRVRLRLEVAGMDCDLHEALGLTSLRQGASLVLCPRWTVDERLASDERKEFTPTPKQMLYANRCSLEEIIVTGRDKAGRVVAACVEVKLCEVHGGAWSNGFVFSAINRPLDDGALYTLDPCPNDWYAYWCSVVVEGLCRGEPNTLYKRLTEPTAAATPMPGLPGQERFLEGLDAFQAVGLLHGFEESKREYIGKHGLAPILLVQGPPGTGKSYSTAFAVFARLQGAMAAGQDCRAFVSCKTHAATDVLMTKVREVQQALARLLNADEKLFRRYFDERLLDVPLFRVSPREAVPDGVIGLEKDREKAKGEAHNADVLQEPSWYVAAITPGGVYRMLKDRWSKTVAGHFFCDLLVLDEASQMNLPEALMAALPLKPDGRLIVVGVHRQMPPIVKHDWETEPRRTFREYQVYQSVFDMLRSRPLPMIQFAESFRVHAAVAEFLRHEIYQHDGIPYHSRRRDVLPAQPIADDMAAAVLRPEYPLVVVVHDEMASQVRNPFEERLLEPIIRALTDPAGYDLDALNGLGVVVPHRAQRAALQDAFPQLNLLDPTSGLPARSAIDTVERFQGGERTVILVSATESDPGYLLAAGEFLLDPRRLTVALSRAKRKMVLIASRSVFSLISPAEEVFASSLLWKNLLARTCTALLWEGIRHGRRVMVWGGHEALRP